MVQFKFNVGDEVIVTNNGKAYDCYNTMAIALDVKNYVEHELVPNNYKGIITGKRNHLTFSNCPVYAIDNKYLIAEDGIELIRCRKDFNWALEQMNLGKKVRRSLWTIKDSYLTKDKSGIIVSHTGSNAYFFIDHFTANDWELYEEPELEYLDGHGKWNKEDKIWGNLPDYKHNFKELRYNFFGDYDYFISTTYMGDSVIWRKKK